MRLKSFLDSFNYALAGIVHTLRTQRNMKVHFFLAALVLVASLIFDISKIELIILFFTIVFVIAMEMVNTSVEVVVDMITEDYSYQARIAKNIAAGAVFMAALNSIVVGYLIFLDDLRALSLSVIHQIKKDPFHIMFITLGLLFIIVIALKARTEKGTPLRGGMPSGHSAIAFSVLTLITLIFENILISTLVLLLTLLVVQSRLEAGTHDFREVFTGGLIGIIITLIIFLLTR